MEVPMDYHLMFMMMSFILLILIGFLLFLEQEFNRTILAFILSFINAILCSITAMAFFGINIMTVDGAGTLINNVYHDLYMLGILFVVLAYVNVLFIFYCIYLFLKKPWEAIKDAEAEKYYSHL